MNTPVQGTAFLVWSASLAQPDRVATVFMAAQACLAMDLQAELYFTGPAVQLLDRAHAALPVGYGASPKALGEWLQETADAGAHLFACSQALHGQELDAAALHAAAGRGGVVQFAARVADPAWRTLVF